jgi:hypothetical protein
MGALGILLEDPGLRKAHERASIAANL